MKQILLFNPEHDLALANGDRHFIAPRNIREMAHDLADIMEAILPSSDSESSFISPLASAHPVPWGWDPAVVEQFKRMGITAQELPTDDALAALSRRSERITAHHLLQQMLPLSKHLTGESYVCRSLDDIKAYATQHSHLLLKAPLSGSGKGLRHVKPPPNPPCEGGTGGISSWADALIRRHGYLTAEPYYDKVQDFAMEFCATDRRCHFIGYSLFTTDTHGRYDSNLLLSDADIEARLSAYIPRSVLHDVCHYVETHADLIVPAEWDTSRFPITFGIDMMAIKTTGKVVIEREQRLLAGSAERSNFNEVNRQQTLTMKGERLEMKGNQPDGNSEFRIQNSEFKLHPCVEINLRCNMGIVAHEVRRHLMAPEATGIYRLALFPDHAALQAFDEEQRSLYPALYRDGLLVQGYCPLTSTEGNTRHLAYIIGKEV